MMKITKAVIPVAGLGTRFLPATKAMPKEMLPVVDKPVVQYLVEEAVASGIKEIIFVTGRGKRAIEDHFDVSYELEDTLVEKNRKDLLKAVRNISSLARFSYVRQPLPLGDGHAILQAAHLVGREPILIMFGDSLYDSAVPAARQLIELYERYESAVVGLCRIPKSQVSAYGVYAGTSLAPDALAIERVAEKPAPRKAPSTLVAVGKYIITPPVFSLLAKLARRKTDEVRLADAFALLIKGGQPCYGKILEGTWLDTGNKLGFIKATIHIGLKHREIRTRLASYLRTVSASL